MGGLTLGAEFETATREAWGRLVEKVLKGADFEKRLVSRTSDGIAIRPLYTRADAVPPARVGRPDAAPFTRGRTVGRSGLGWDIRQMHLEPDPARANAAILEDLAGGVTSIALQIAAPGAFGVPYNQGDLARALDGVDLEICPVHLVAGEYTVDAAGSLTAIWRASGLAPERWAGSFGYDPLGTLARTGALYHPAEKALAIAAKLAADVASMPGVTALAADGVPHHCAGASEGEELAAVLATLVAHLRAGEAAGLAPATVLAKTQIALAVDADQFLSIAKLRAARRLVWRVAEACGAGAAGGAMPVTAVTSWRMMAARDPWVNMLRSTIACAAAAMGGADAIVVLPHSFVLGRPDAFARRVARNTQIVLQEESGLGRVADPAGGSFAVEALTDDLAAKAWQIFQEIEGKGGMAAALASGAWQDRLAATAERRARDLATGKSDLIGVSAFPLLADDGVTAEPWPMPLSAELNGARVRPLRFARAAEPFEKLRDAAGRAGGAKVHLARLGGLADHAARGTWTANLLAAGGIAAVGEGAAETAEEAVAAFKASGARVACLVSSDARYATLAEPAAEALKAAGAEAVLLAGRPGDKEAAFRAAGVDAFLFAGADRLAVLTDLHRRLNIVA